MIEPPQADVDDLDAELVLRAGATALTRSSVSPSSDQTLESFDAIDASSREPKAWLKRRGDALVKAGLGSVERPGRAKEPLGIDDPPRDVARDLEVPLVARDQLPRRRVEHPEPAVD